MNTKLINSIFPQSNTSLDSIDQIPFANENAGTIKQRGGPPNMPAAYYQQMQRQQQQQPYHHHHQRTMSGGADSSGGSDELAELEGLESLRIEDDDDDIRVGGSSSNCSSGAALQQQVQAQAPTTAPSDINANVLSDIGNMLANLTDELDAMLEEEKLAGLNDDD